MQGLGHYERIGQQASAEQLNTCASMHLPLEVTGKVLHASHSDKATYSTTTEAQPMLIPKLFDKVRRQGRAGKFQVSRVDLIRQIADLLPLDTSYFAEQDVPFAVLDAATEDRSEQAQPSTLG